MSQRITPNVSSSEEIVQVSTISNSDGLLFALPVISPIGPIEPTIANNSTVCKKFMINDLKRSDDITLKMAYAMSKYSNVMVCRATNTNKCNGVNQTGTSITYDLDTKSVASNNNDFIIYVPYPAAQNTVKVQITRAYSPAVAASGETPASEEQLGQIEITDLLTGMGKFTYEFSMNEDSVDGYGQPLFIEQINEKQNFVVIAVADSGKNKGVETWGSAVEIGKEGTYNPASITNAHLTEALNKLTKKSYRKVTVIWDAGKPSTVLAENMNTLASKLKCLSVISHPQEYSTPAEVVAYIESLGMLGNGAYNFTYGCTPWRKDTSITSFPIWVPYGFDYLRDIVTNFNGNGEFKPVFGIKNAAVGGNISNMSISYVKTDDPDDEENTVEVIQKKGWNPAFYDEGVGYAYLVNNLTAQGQKDPLSEENNRRMWNQIRFDVDTTLTQFLSDPNNEATRLEIEKVLNDYFDTVVLNWGYSVAGWKVYTDPYNPALPNTINVYVDLQFNNSTKYIRVYYRSVPVMAAA